MMIDARSMPHKGSGEYPLKVKYNLEPDSKVRTHGRLTRLSTHKRRKSKMRDQSGCDSSGPLLIFFLLDVHKM